MNGVLGGPGLACSAMRIRRLAAGELAGAERARTEEHLAACARCQEVGRELEAERRRLEAELPFEEFAAGVAERLARPTRTPPRRLAGLGVALAAGVLCAVAVPIVLRVSRDEPGVRTKGGAELTLWVQDGGAARALAPGEPIPPRASLRVGLTSAGRRFAAVALVDADGAVILHAGAAPAGVLPGAFEWTGAGEGTLVAVLDDAPIDAAALAERLARDGPAAAGKDGGAEVVLRPLRRGPP
jgi:hypothetical protein